MTFRIGIDASNLLEGGGITHLVEFLAAAHPEEQGIGPVVVWGGQETLARLVERPWLELRAPAGLAQGSFRRLHWQHFELAAAARDERCELLFSPGGNYTGNFRPFVTMSRNMLPFDRKEVARYGWSKRRLRLEILRRTQAHSFRRADGLIFLTDYARNTVLSMIGRVRGHVATIPHGVSGDFDAPSRAFRKISDCSPADPFRMIYVSHASPYKHQWHVIEAVAELRRETGWPLRLDLIGPRSFPDSIKLINSAIERFDPRGEWVAFHGPKPSAQVREQLRLADLGIFASSCENMPNILLEKMAAGLPVVSSDRGPMPEVLHNAGLYFDPESPPTLVEALRGEIADDTQRRHHSQMALARAATFQWERTARDTFAFLRQVAETSRGPATG